MPGDGPRLRRALDARALVPDERDAVTGRLTSQARERKHDHRSRPRSRHLVRHVLRTPAGIAGAVLVAVAAVVGVTVAATAGSSDQAPASRGSRPGLPMEVGDGGDAAAPAGAQPPPACDLITAADASRIMGEKMQTLAAQTGHDCNYWDDKVEARDSLTVGWSVPESVSALRDVLTEHVSLHDAPALGEGAYTYPAASWDAGAGTRQWQPAGARFVYGGYGFWVTIGHSDGRSHTVDPSGDEQLSLVVAEQLLAALKAGAGGLSAAIPGS